MTTHYRATAKREVDITMTGAFPIAVPGMAEPALECVIDGDGFRVSLRQEYLVPNPKVEPDPNWRHADANGHVHRYAPDFTTPTLIKRTRVEVDEWEGDSWDVEELVCLECGEVVEPGKRYIPQALIPRCFLGEYAGPMAGRIFNPGDEIEIGDLIPGFGGRATLEHVTCTYGFNDTARCEIHFRGQGELKGIEHGRMGG
jgi:hypothetical protein